MVKRIGWPDEWILNMFIDFKDWDDQTIGLGKKNKYIYIYIYTNLKHMDDPTVGFQRFSLILKISTARRLGFNDSYGFVCFGWPDGLILNSFKSLNHFDDPIVWF